MKTIDEEAKEYAKRQWSAFENPPSHKLLGSEKDFKAGFECAEKLIPTNAELPEIKEEEYQVLGLLRNGEYKTFWIGESVLELYAQCSHWRPLNRK